MEPYCILVQAAPQEYFPDPEISQIPAAYPAHCLPCGTTPSPEVQTDRQADRKYRVPVQMHAPDIQELLSPGPLQNGIMHEAVYHTPDTPVSTVYCKPSSALSAHLSVLRSPWQTKSFLLHRPQWKYCLYKELSFYFCTQTHRKVL